MGMPYPPGFSALLVDFDNGIDRSSRIDETTVNLTLWYEGVPICRPSIANEASGQAPCTFTTVGHARDGLIELDPIVVAQDWFLGSD